MHRVRLGYDDTLFTGPDASPHWQAGYVPDGVVAPIRALWVDEGRPADGTGRVADPSLTAATYFAAGPARGRRPGQSGTGAAPGARTARRPSPRSQSAPLPQIVERVLQVSDNEAAEVLGHQVGLASGGPGLVRRRGAPACARPWPASGIPVAGSSGTTAAGSRGTTG